MRIDILLSTYNGGRFLREQLDSIYSQTHRDWRLIARDDGSTDGSRAILAEYAANDPNRFVLSFDDRSLGAKESFGWLLTQSSADYIAFCDQDDIWLPHKLERLLEVVQAEEAGDRSMPVLAHSDLEVVGEALQPLMKSFWAYQGIDARRDALHQLMVQNVVTGCATLFNKALRDLALPVPEAAFMHDYWLALVASACGKIVSLSEPLVRYRQHGRNTVGAKKMPGILSLFRITFTRSGWKFDYYAACAQAAALRNFLASRREARGSDAVTAFADLYQRRWLGRRWVLIRHGVFPARLRRQISVLMRV